MDTSILIQPFNDYIQYLDAGLIGMFGGLANYFYYIDRQHIKFKFRHLLTTSMLAFFIGVVGYIFLPDGPNKPGYLMICGFFCYKIIEFIDKNGEKIVKALLKKGG